jgi:hypothetical protein
MAMIRVEIEGNNVVDVMDTMQTMVPYKTQENILLGMTLQELLLYTDQRCQAEGYEMEVTRNPAERKKEEARAKLRGDLEASLDDAQKANLEEIKKVLTEDEPEPAPKKVVAPKKTNGKGETDAQRKAQCIRVLQQLYANGRKAEVNKILADYGDGAKNFNTIPEDKFGGIKEAIEALPA